MNEQPTPAEVETPAAQPVAGESSQRAVAADATAAPTTPEEPEQVDAVWRDVCTYAVKALQEIANGDRFHRPLSARGAQRIARAAVVEIMEATGANQEEAA